MPRFGGHHVPLGRITLFLSEAIVVATASLAGWRLAPGAPPDETGALAIGVGVLGSFYFADLYDLSVARHARAVERLLAALGTLAAATLLASLFVPAAARSALVFAFAGAAAGAAGVRALVPSSRLGRRIFLVAEGAAASIFAREIAESEDEIVATCPPTAPDLPARARAARAEVVVVACDERRGLPMAPLLRCRISGLEVLFALDYLERTRRKLPVELIRPSSLVYVDGFVRSRLGEAVRRLLNLSAAVIVLFASLPIMFIAAIAVKLSSPGPVFYRQERVGRQGRVFQILKFRTMHCDAEAVTGAVWAREGDPRVTPVGRLLRKARIDELPQLFNVLAGDMDVVGPRPERPEFVARLREEIPYYDLRHLVRPGLTGWAQIRFPYGASIEDARHKLGFDLYYVKRASPLLDAIILFHTAKIVLTGWGAR